MTEETLVETKEPVEAPVKKTRAKRKTKTPAFTEKDLAEFQAWKKERESAEDKDLVSRVVVNAPADSAARQLWEEEKKLVKGIFRCREPEGGTIKFAFRKFKWDPVKWYILEDGKQYEIPLAVARHLNDNCNYAIHSHVLGADGNPTLDTSGKIKSRMNFESTQFLV